MEALNKLSSVKSRTLLFGIFVAVVVLVDQVTKSMIVNSFSEGEILTIIEGAFNLTLTYNRGAAFGILSSYPDHIRWPILTATTILALSAVVYFLVKDYAHDRIAQVALASIAGGAVGNIIDRLRLGKVIDFIDWYYGNYHWPAFNIADSAICVGVVVLLLRRPLGTPTISPATRENC